jgi:LysM repeat protein
MKNSIFFILLLFILTSCQFNKTPAPIIYNHKKSDSGSFEDTAASEDDNSEIIAASEEEIKSEIVSPVDPVDSENYVIPAKSPIEEKYKIIYHEVEVGETIDDIALKYGQTVNQIATLNSLLPPYELDEFQIIKIKMLKEKLKPQLKQEEKKKEPIIVKETSKEETAEFIRPVDGKILLKFGQNAPYGINKGINISAKEGTKIVASAGGKVIYADYDAIFGNLIIIKVDGKNVVTSYAHMEDLIISKGQSVKQGDIIGYVGNTGKVDNFQLHFAIREGKSAKDPLTFIKYN